MFHKDSSLLSSSTISNMDINQLDKKDISKVFAYLRNKLNSKEKELLELQRSQPNLSGPDCEQIDTLIDLISSIQLSTQDGSFIFASNSNSSSSSSPAVCSTDVQSIKTLPTNVWLPQSNSLKTEREKEHENKYRLPMVTHLLSLPVNAYVSSSSSSLPSSNQSTEKKDEPSNRLPMVSQLLSMPINAFNSSSNNQSKSFQSREEDKQTINQENKSRIETSKSIFHTEKVYSKEHWIRRTSESESDFEYIPLDLDKYIEQTSDKMRRLHNEYLEAIEKLKKPPESINSTTQILQSMYPQTFDRIKEDMSPTDLNRIINKKK